MKEKQVSITIEPGDQVLAFLKVLRLSGLYGRTLEEVAERLICQQLIELIRAKVITDEAAELQVYDADTGRRREL